MQFDAFKVAVTLSVVDKISPILGSLSKRLQMTGRDVEALAARFERLQKYALAGSVMTGAGLGMLATLKAPVDAAIAYEKAFGRFKELNLGEAINEDANKFAKGAQVYGVSAREMMNSLRDLHTVMGNYSEAKDLAPKIASLGMANSVLFGDKGKLDERALYAVEKVAEARGGKNSPEAFMRQLDIAQKFVSGTGGNVSFEDLLTFTKTAGVAMRGLSDEGFLKFEPLIQAMGGSRAGTALMSAYQNLVGGRTTKRAAMELIKYGLLDPKMVTTLSAGAMDIRPGALKDSALAKSDFIGWVGADLLPALAKHGVTKPEDVVAVINTLLTNRTGANEVSMIATMLPAIMQNFAVNKNALGTDATIENAKNTPEGKLVDLQKRWDDLKVQLGENLLPILVKVNHALADMVKFMTRHEQASKYLLGVFTGIGAILTVGGPLLILVSVFKGLGEIVKLMVGAGIEKQIASVAAEAASVGTELSALGAGLGVVAAALGGAGIGWLFNKGFEKGTGISLGSWLYDLDHPNDGNPNFVPAVPAGAQRPIQVKTQINLDGKPIADVVTDHQTRQAGRDIWTAITYDPSMTHHPPSIPLR